MNIEKALKAYLNGTGPKPTYKEFAQNMTDGEDASCAIFDLVNDELDSMSDEKSLDRTSEVLKYLGVVISNDDKLNRRLVERKLNKLFAKTNTMEIEGHNKFNMHHLSSELNKIRNMDTTLLDLLGKEETKQYTLMKYLINELKQIEYLEFSIEHMPNLINVRDKDENHIIINIIKRYIENVIDFNEDNLIYYNNLISFIINQKNFHITDKERRECLDEINKCINKLSYKKKVIKENKEGLKYLSKLLNTIKSATSNKKDIETIASKYNININFNENILNNIKLMSNPNISDRTKIEDYCITIDKPNTFEIDDALSCIKLSNGNYLLGVHIASVLGYLPYSSCVIDEAIKRGQTIYLKKVIPIFPLEFSGEVASLKEGEERLTRTYYFEIDDKGNIVKEDFIKSVITNNKKTSYKEVNAIMKDKTSNVDLNNTITNLKEVTDLIKNNFHPSKLYTDLKENTLDPTELRVNKSGAENIVLESMMLTGKEVAEYFYNNNYPCLYRIHTIKQENAEKLEELIDNLTRSYGGGVYKDLYQLIDGIYPKGKYATSGSHEGLGLKHYCHCTSSLRRAADIVVEHALDVCLDNTPTEEDLEALQKEIDKRCQQINNKNSSIEWFVEDYQKVYRRR